MFNNQIAYITCACGQMFQVLVESIDSDTITITWDEGATAQIYNEHLTICNIGGGKT